MTTNDKIPIGKLHFTCNPSGEYHYYAEIKLKQGIEIKDGYIITLDMIEPYESEAVRKVSVYLSGCMDSPIGIEYKKEHWIDHAKKIVELVHEAEDADE